MPFPTGGFNVSSTTSITGSNVDRKAFLSGNCSLLDCENLTLRQTFNSSTNISFGGCFGGNKWGAGDFIGYGVAKLLDMGTTLGGLWMLNKMSGNRGFNPTSGFFGGSGASIFTTPNPWNTSDLAINHTGYYNTPVTTTTTTTTQQKDDTDETTTTGAKTDPKEKADPKAQAKPKDEGTPTDPDPVTSDNPTKEQWTTSIKKGGHFDGNNIKATGVNSVNGTITDVSSNKNADGYPASFTIVDYAVDKTNGHTYKFEFVKVNDNGKPVYKCTSATNGSGTSILATRLGENDNLYTFDRLTSGNITANKNTGTPLTNLKLGNTTNK